jgi:hypothetical protein
LNKIANDILRDVTYRLYKMLVNVISVTLVREALIPYADFTDIRTFSTALSTEGGK